MNKLISNVAREYFFTFGVGTPMEDYCQPIVAARIEEAENTMFKYWKNNWAQGYSKLEFAQKRKEGKFQDLKALPAITSFETMTAKEMSGWQNRFTNIIELDGSNKQVRLMALLDDVEIATDLVNDPFARKLHTSIMEEMELA